MSTFSRLHPRLQHAIATRLGWPQLRPVQEQAGAAILDGENAIVLAPTAGGKTEAALFPTLSLLLEREPVSVGALYVAPIKALLNNQEDRLGQYAEMVGLSRFVWHGDTAQRAKGRFCKHPDALLMTTPESLEVMLVSPRVPTAELFRDLRIVVIDEVHAFAGTDRGAHLMSVLERLARVAERDIQRVGLSATVGNPEELLIWLQGSSKRMGRVVDPPKPKSAREITVRFREDTAALATEAARHGTGKKSLFFCQSRSLAETVAERMRGDELDVFVHHSSVSLEERQAAEARFASGTNACIVCTSTLELGIDVGDLDLVFQPTRPAPYPRFSNAWDARGAVMAEQPTLTFFVKSLQRLHRPSRSSSSPATAGSSAFPPFAAVGPCSSISSWRSPSPTAA